MGDRADAVDAREGQRGSFDGSFRESVGVPGASLAWAIGVIIALFVVFAIGRVVLDAANAAARVEALRATNAQLRARVDALTAERQLITSPIFVEVAGRGRGYGAPNERAFGLVSGGPPPPQVLPADASTSSQPSPLDAWLTLLFGG